MLGLKNSYQSAFSHYLAGFVYEALGERGLAAPGYRKAAELRPETPLLEQALLDLDSPPPEADESEVLVVIQSGFAPARDSVRIPCRCPWIRAWWSAPCPSRYCGTTTPPARLPTC